MKPVKYPETIFCELCSENVRMVDCRALDKKVKGRPIIEFDYACVSCGHRSSASREWEFLQFSEREFCQMNGLGVFVSKKKVKTAVR